MTLKLAQFVDVFLLMLVTGVLWGTWFGLGRSMSAIAPETFLENGRAFIRNLAWPMRILFPASLLATLWVLFLLNRAPERARAGFYVVSLGFLLFVVALVITLSVNVPIDHEIKRWTLATLPASWRSTRDRWKSYHAMRTFVSLAGFGFVLAGVLLASAR